MRKNVTRKIIEEHLLSGKMEAGREIALRIDHTLTHDVTGTQAYLAFETLGIGRVQTELSVSYIDHNLLYADNKNADDHLYLQCIAKKYGIRLSKAGNGICHTVHFERFGIPGKTLLGSDSHTPTGGAIGMLAIGAGGLDVALAMAGEPLWIRMPEVVGVHLTGRLGCGVSAKDVALEMLRRHGVKGGFGKVFEYFGPGVSTIGIRDRSTITNMGAEMGATTSIFPSDEKTGDFFARERRKDSWRALSADDGAEYDTVEEIDLSSLVPLCAAPDMPDNIKAVSELRVTKVDQVFIGSCTNASYTDFVKAALILDGRCANENVSFVAAPGSRQIFQELLRDGIIEKLVDSGARIMECGCGACVGIGQAPQTGGVSLRTSNRNFRGRTGTLDASIFLCSPETAAASAIAGHIVPASEVFDCSSLGDIEEPEHFIVDDRLLLEPAPEGTAVEIIRGPNIKPMPICEPMPEEIVLKVCAKRGDNITTDDIIPANAQFSALRSNIPAISEITFGRIDPGFAQRCRGYGRSIIIGGENYGQGSSREHAAIAPMYLGVRAVLAKSIARIHRNNLINHGILPLIFENEEDYCALEEGDTLVISGAPSQTRSGTVSILHKRSGRIINTGADLSEREREIVIAGGALCMAKHRLSAAGQD